MERCPRPGIAGLSFAALCAVLVTVVTGALLVTSGSLVAQQSPDIEKRLKNRSPSWNPPNIDKPVKSVSASPPCVLANVLEQAAARTNELFTDLQNFTAQEMIGYRTSDREGFVLDGGSETFEYVVVFPHAQGLPVVEESRNPVRGSSLSVMTVADRGLPEMVLMFLPNMQDDYKMKCEGTVEWKGQRTWVVHFEQRPDKPGRTFSFHDENVEYPARLKGHAWIAADSGQVVHLETGLMEEIPVTKVHQWYLAIDYVPVQFKTSDARIWLPQIADSYYEFGDRQTIIYHTFTDFLLFSVQTDLKIGKPKQP